MKEKEMFDLCLAILDDEEAAEGFVEGLLEVWEDDAVGEQ